ncbi:hypothetical protein OE749_08345 [Aestuariibacter sp. AA17]|uniref:Uncharacterized protein n=1 Tax=Fluctibacter corallii TaxID=2984329 RepID=A0ABT3A7S7_9ALTE|nr:hypothetical protein [Aestuariibacter sp. AA17]MCV2884704.1 hypothetical protein [Aestuariibacter sp. AA17]
MQKTFKPYSADLLPNNFSYPQRYIDISNGTEKKQTIWMFEDANNPRAELTWQLRNNYKKWKNIGDRQLIPLAKLNDWAAFFDGDCVTGNPKVIVIDLGNEQISYEEEDFDAWYEKACMD